MSKIQSGIQKWNANVVHRGELNDSAQTVDASNASAPALVPAVAAHKPAPATLDPTTYDAWNPNKVYWGEWQDDAHTIHHPGGASYVEYQGAIWVAAYYNVDYTPGELGSPWTLADNSPDVVTTQVKPEAPDDLTAGYTSDTSVALFWKPSQVLGVGHVTSYNVYENGAKIGTTTSTSFTVSHLSAAKGYTFTVDAVDTIGNSQQSDALAVHTTGATTSSGQYFSPFVDMTLPSTDLVDLSRDSGLRDFTLAFTQSAGLESDGTLAQGVTPTVSWGGLSATTLPTGAIVDEVHQVEAEGGDITISFGGYNGRDAAAVAEMYSHNLQTGSSHYSAAVADNIAIANLQSEFQSVIDTYGVHHLDFDIETDFYNNVEYVNPNGPGNLVDDMVANHMRDMALKSLKIANPDLEISYTVATTPHGLAQNYQDLLALTKTDGLKIDVVNIMAMDYFDGDTNDMADNAISAAKAVHQELHALGIDAKISITPMIGQNDDVGTDGVVEIFTLNDAARLEKFAHTYTSWVAGMGMWELPRDSFADTDTTGQAPSSTSSGVIQQAFAFSEIFSKIAIETTSGADNITGDAGDNVIFGLAGKDHLNGSDGNDMLDGGLGDDVLTGGTGKDSFIFDTTLGVNNVDTIKGYEPDHDHILLDNAIFAKLGATGALNANFFVANSTGTAMTAHEYIVYNTSTGALSYDVDGSGSHAAIQFATLANHAVLHDTDFMVI